MHITVLHEPGLPSRSLTIDIVALLCDFPDVTVCVRDTAAIRAQGITGDVFVNSHGEVYPVDIEAPLLAFFQAGGGFLHLGGAPFETAMARAEDGEWVELVRTLGEMRQHIPQGPVDAPIDLFRAQLGMMTYTPAYPLTDAQALRQEFDADLIGAAPLAGTLPQLGLNLCTTMPIHTARPDLFLCDHRIYMAKPVIRDTHLAGALLTPAGSRLLNSLLLSKHWGNPLVQDQSVGLKPWAIFTGQVDATFPREILDGMVRWLECPAVLGQIDLTYATVHAGETVTTSVTLHGALPAGWQVQGFTGAQTRDELRAGQAIAWQSCAVARQNQCYQLAVADVPDAFLLPVRFVLMDAQGRVRDYAESALVRWQPQAVADAPRITAHGRYLDVEQAGQRREAQWVPGANWQDRHQNAFSWHNPNLLRVAEDARTLADAGMVMVRSHYFMPGWFHALGVNVFGKTHPGLYEQFEMGPELSEQHLRALEAHFMLFNAFGLCYMPTLYTNVGPNMGDPAMWLSNSRVFNLPGLIDNQRVFARQVMARLGELPGVIWDLYNEPDTDIPAVGDWLREMHDIWGASGHMASVGLIYPAWQNVMLGEGADWHSIHMPCCKVSDDFHSGKPCLFQEAWVPTPSTPVGEEDLEFYLHRGISWSLQFGATAFMPWNWNMFLANWRYGTDFVEYWDNELGCGVHADNTPRRGFITMRNWARFMEGIAFAQDDDRQVVFVFPRSGLQGAGTIEYLDLLHAEGIPFTSLNDRDVACADLSQAKLVILPYFARGYRQATWERLRAFAAGGGVVWAHNDSLALDEDGNVVPERAIPIHEGKEPVDQGYFVWCMGMNYKGSEQSLADYIRLLKELPLLRREKNIRPLQEGTMRFSERWSTDEKTMKTDWMPCDKLPDRNVVRQVEIIDAQGKLQRGWSGEGEAFQLDKLAISSPGPLFVIKRASGTYQVTAEEIHLTGLHEAPQTRLLDERSFSAPRPIDVSLNWQRQGDAWVLTLASWQRMCWVEIVV